MSVIHFILTDSESPTRQPDEAAQSPARYRSPEEGVSRSELLLELGMQTATSTTNQQIIDEESEVPFLIEELEARFEMETVPTSSFTLLLCGCDATQDPPP